MSNYLFDYFVIVEDDIDYSNFLAPLIKTIYPSYSYSSFTHPQEAIESDLLETRVKYVFFDLYFFAESGLSYIPKICSKYFNAEIIVFSSSESSSDLIRSIELGAAGYVVKTFDEQKIMGYLQILKEGGSLVGPKIAKKLIERLQITDKHDKSKILTPSEEKTLSILSMGKSYEETAELLGITLNGLRSRIRKIYKTLNVSNRIAAIESYRKNKFLN